MSTCKQSLAAKTAQTPTSYVHEQVVLFPVAHAFHQTPQECGQLGGLQNAIAGGAHLRPHSAHKLHVAGDVLADAIQKIQHILQDQKCKTNSIPTFECPTM